MCYNSIELKVGGINIVDNQAWEETKEYYLKNKEQQLAEEIIALLKARNEIDIALYNKRQEYAKLCGLMDKDDERTK